MTDASSIPESVAQVFDQFSPADRSVLLAARALILRVASRDGRIGGVEETLKWGEPAYVPRAKNTGSTVRLGVEKITGSPALFFNCKTTLVEEMREHFGADLSFSKNRAVLLDAKGRANEDALEFGVASALTYHLRK